MIAKDEASRTADEIGRNIANERKDVEADELVIVAHGQYNVVQNADGSIQETRSNRAASFGFDTIPQPDGDIIADEFGQKHIVKDGRYLAFQPKGATDWIEIQYFCGIPVFHQAIADTKATPKEIKTRNDAWAANFRAMIWWRGRK